MRVKRGEGRDAMVGAIVLIVGAVLLGFVYGKEARTSSDEGYAVTARFRHAEGLAPGSSVRLSGVVVGKVVATSLDPEYRAVATLRIARNIALPTDTAAAIQTDGLLGAKYIELKPGAEDSVLNPGAEITYTQDSMVIEDLLDMIISQARVKRGYAGKPLPNFAK